MKLLNALLILMLILFVSACSNNNEGKASADHVWKEQTDAIDKARGVEALMQKTAEEQRKSIEEQVK